MDFEIHGQKDWERAKETGKKMSSITQDLPPSSRIE